MTAPPIERPTHEPREVDRDPAAVRTALAAHADNATLALYDHELGQAPRRCRS
jgi:hypothetical protein